MSEDPLYEVSILERLDDGRLAWHGLLRTRDRAEATGLYESLMADEGVKAKLEEVIPAKKR